MKNQCCFTTYNSSYFFYTINEKKAPECAPFNTDVSKAISILEKTTKSTPIETLRTELTPIMENWKNNAAAVTTPLIIKRP
jgi:hypothetical protein